MNKLGKEEGVGHETKKVSGGQVTWNFQNHWKDFVFYVKKEIVEIKTTQ